MNMNKALQNLYHAVSGSTTTKVNISKLLVDIHYAITGVESSVKNNWSRIIDSMATNWPEGGGGGGGVDMPTFTVTYSNDWETLISATCDKTYAECRQYLANDNCWASLTEKNQAGTEVYENVSCPTMTDQSGNDITYTATLSIRPSYDIKYHSDGTITVVNPSAYLETLNITQNGSYFPTGGYIDEVNVNV